MSDKIWCGPNGKPCLPKYLFPYYAKLIHGEDHVSKGGMQTDIQRYWFTKGFSNYSQKFCQKYVICSTNNVGRGIQTPQVHFLESGYLYLHLAPNEPFDHLQMDFIELTQSEGKKYCLVVDMFSK